MTKQVLHGIGVDSKEELKERIYRYFDEINADPVVYHWGWNLQIVAHGFAVLQTHGRICCVNNF
ncbi:MAG: transposase [Lachnospiraceae bacterium]|nr:transposase [Lachnospiraceae bacterium]